MQKDANLVVRSRKLLRNVFGKIGLDTAEIESSGLSMTCWDQNMVCRVYVRSMALLAWLHAVQPMETFPHQI